MSSPIYDIEVTSLDGAAYALSEHAGKVLLIVNTASKCGFTPQYQGLESLHRQFADRGLVVLGFPCNQFGHQEPGNEGEIEQFCELNFGVTFPLFAKIDVNGANAAPLYRHLKEAEKTGDGTHREAREAMKGRWRHPKKSMGWYRDVKQAFADLPSEQPTTRA